MAQQRVGAQEAQADVGGLGEVLQHRRVGEPLGARPAVDQRHHNLNKHAFISREAGVYLREAQAQDGVAPLRSPRGRCASIPWCRSGRRLLIYERWAASQTSRCTRALNLGGGKSDICDLSFFYSEEISVLRDQFQFQNWRLRLKRDGTGDK